MTWGRLPAGGGPMGRFAEPTSEDAEPICPDNCRICIDTCPQSVLDQTAIDLQKCREICFFINRGWGLAD
jgi:hypothetical protein